MASDLTPSKYAKFAYDTGFSFNVAKSVWEVHEAAPDSMLAFYINGYVYVRRICDEFHVSGREVVSRWTPCEGIRVGTIIIPDEKGHIRKHIIESDRDCTAYDCGFAVEIDVAEEKQLAGESFAQVKNFYSGCKVSVISGKGRGEVIVADPNTNLLHPMTRIPAVCYQIGKGKNEIITEVTAEYRKKD